MSRAPLLFLPALLAVWSTSATEIVQVPRYAVHEVEFSGAGWYANPYLEVTAEATLTEPNGRTTRMLPLFWDGGAVWKMRFAPDKVGKWTWVVKSSDPGMHLLEGAFACVPSDLRGGLEPMPEAPRHFQYQNGERMWFMGDTAWAYVTDDLDERHNRMSSEWYLTHRLKQGFNVIHFMLVSEAGWGSSAGPPWHDIAGERLNPAYFAEADRRILFANQREITTGIAVAWGDKGRKEPWSWNKLPDLAARKRFARYVGSRFGAYDVYFIVAGEWHGEARARWAPELPVRGEFVMIGEALRAADPHRRMMTIHPMIDHGSTREFNEVAPWMDFADYQQNYRDLHGRVLASRRLPKPIVNSEYAYFLRDSNGDGKVDKPHSYTVDDIRHATWDIVMAGAYFITGFGSTYMGGHRHPGVFYPEEPRNVPWERQVTHVKRLFTRLEYWLLQPADELITSAAPRSADRAARVELEDRHLTITQVPATTYWCLATPGRTYVAYVRGLAEPFRLELPAGAAWKAERFDPRTGRTENVACTVEGGGATLLPPDEQDWVYVVRAESGATVR